MCKSIHLHFVKIHLIQFTRRGQWKKRKKELDEERKALQTRNPIRQSKSFLRASSYWWVNQWFFWTDNCSRFKHKPKNQRFCLRFLSYHHHQVFLFCSSFVQWDCECSTHSFCKIAEMGAGPIVYNKMFHHYGTMARRRMNIKRKCN